MASKEDIKIAEKQTKELFELLLKKTGVKKKDLFDLTINCFIRDNLDLVTPEEKKNFPNLVFGIDDVSSKESSASKNEEGKSSTKEAVSKKHKKCNKQKSAFSLYWEEMGDKTLPIFDMKAVLK